MSIEVVLFVIVGSISVMAAVMMLLSENAVHSALFLILNFLCVAFLYVMLDAGFLAIVQVAVYAGAIMVLFLFVIMLLGAEKVTRDARHFAWMPWVALGLALVFLITVSVAFIAGEIDEQDLPEGQAQVRIIHVAPDLGVVDVQLNDEAELFAEGLDFEQRGEGEAPATEFEAVDPGEYVINLITEGNTLPVGTVTLAADKAYSVIVYGEGETPEMFVLEEDLDTLFEREGRVTVFNAFTAAGAVNLVDTGGDYAFDSQEDADEAPVIAANLEPGMVSETVVERVGEMTWAFVHSDNTDLLIKRVNDFEVERNTNNLVILTGQRDAVNPETLAPMVVPIEVPAKSAFGGPAAVGEVLYVDYVLPFEMVAVLLLAAMVGVIVLTHREVKPKMGRAQRHRVSRPLTSVIAAQIGQPVDDSDSQPDTTQ